jgi:hypothetical protein
MSTTRNDLRCKISSPVSLSTRSYSRSRFSSCFILYSTVQYCILSLQYLRILRIEVFGSTGNLSSRINLAPSGPREDSSAMGTSEVVLLDAVTPPVIGEMFDFRTQTVEALERLKSGGTVGKIVPVNAEKKLLKTNFIMRYISWICARKLQ